MKLLNIFLPFFNCIIHVHRRQPALPTTRAEEYCGISIFPQFGLDEEVASKEHMMLPSNAGQLWGKRWKHKLQNWSLVALPQQTGMIINSFLEIILLNAYLNRCLPQNHSNTVLLRHSGEVWTECMLRSFVLIVIWEKTRFMKESVGLDELWCHWKRAILPYFCRNYEKERKISGRKGCCNNEVNDY